MPKFGQARIPTPAEWDHLFDEIQKHRYPEKNTAIMRISRHLGLRVQEIALLELKEVVQLIPESPGFRLLKVMALPANITKGSRALAKSTGKERRVSVTFKLDEFDRLIETIRQKALAGEDINPKDYYPKRKARKGTSRDLPMVAPELRAALEDHLRIRLEKLAKPKPSDPLFVTQKGGRYSPNTLQEHMSLMLKGWAGIEKASSHSGRRALITDVIHNQGRSVKVAQKIAGHKTAATTIIYEDPPEGEVAEALENIKK